MSTFEKKLKRFQDAEERKRNKPMSKPQHLTKLIKSLEQQLAATKDPQLKADLSRQLTTLLSKKPRTLSKKGRSLRAIYTGSLYDAMSVGDLVTHHLVLQIENKRRELRRDLTRTEKNAITAEVKAVLSQEELAAFEN